MSVFKFVSDHDGNFMNGALPIAEAIKKAEPDVKVLCALNCCSTAWKNRQNVYARLKEMSLLPVGMSPLDAEEFITTPTTALVTTLSPEPGGLEQRVTQAALEKKIPVYAIEEVPGGRYNVGWDEEPEHLVRKVRRLITVAPDPKDPEYPVTPESIVGPLHLGRYENVDWHASAESARKKLGVTPEEHVIWAICHPEPESPAWLIMLGAAVCGFAWKAAPQKVVMVVTRHRKELTERAGRMIFRAPAYQYALYHISKHGVRVIDNSEDFFRPDVPSVLSVRGKFRPTKFASYTEMLALCMEQGVVVTGFATAGLLDAPYLGIPSALFIDEADEFGYHYGAHLKREPKGLPAENDRRFTDGYDLEAFFEAMLLPIQRLGREQHRDFLHELFSWPLVPEDNPPGLAARLILDDLKGLS